MNLTHETGERKLRRHYGDKKIWSLPFSGAFDLGHSDARGNAKASDALQSEAAQAATEGLLTAEVSGTMESRDYDQGQVRQS